tara:strand:+ start:333 stop:680 length:348 start_codon:yes stop_codon:yes gene_type:complete
MIDTDKYEGHTTDWEWKDKEWGVALCGGDSSAGVCGEICCDTPDGKLAQDAPLLLAEVIRLREDYEKMSEVLRQHGMDICRHCRVIYRDDDMNHPHYPSLHPWHMDGMCMKEMIE